ncbi:MAG: thioredoxin family protein [Planctomycetes bacterium]|nr:thioredoxin family protein [Planctomycetota bacterium]
MLIKEKERKTIEAFFAKHLVAPVKLVLFTQKESPLVLPDSVRCAFCKETEEVVKDLAALSGGKVTAEIHDFAAEPEKAREYGVDKIPAIAIVGARDTGIRFFGTPMGYEFTTLVEDVADASRGATSLSPAVKARLALLDRDVRIQVFVTLTCPYCPKAVRLAHQFALENPRIRAEMVESSEFPFLVQRHGIMGVPRVIVNDDPGFEGAMPEPVFLIYVLKAAGALTEEERKVLEEAERKALEAHMAAHHGHAEPSAGGAEKPPAGKKADGAPR